MKYQSWFLIQQNYSFNILTLIKMADNIFKYIFLNDFVFKLNSYFTSISMA